MSCLSKRDKSSPYFDHFEIDLVSALSRQLVGAFDDLVAAPLTDEKLDDLPRGQGVYQLYHKDSLVYVGKSDSLRGRLSQHRKKITGRRNIAVSEVRFKCLFVHRNWTALAPERSLIRYHKNAGAGECPWNGNSFGPNDPGRNRETTNKPTEGFDKSCPIRDDWPCEWIAAGEHRGGDLLISLKKRLPYLLRYQTEAASRKRGHPDYNNISVNVPTTGMPARDLLGTIARQLTGWQATIFPSYMILYKERRSYTHGEIIWPPLE